jgi:hypothetical protein
MGPRILDAVPKHALGAPPAGLGQAAGKGEQDLESFAQTLREWDVFYSTVSLASVTLAGLLFVSLSLRLERAKVLKDAHTVRLARGSFGDFLYVLMLGLVFLVPHKTPVGLAVALFALGLGRTVGLVRQVVTTVRRTPGKGVRPSALREIALPALASLGLLVVGFEVLRGELIAMYGLVLVVAALLASASWNAWLILITGDEPAH